MLIIELILYLMYITNKELYIYIYIYMYANVGFITEKLSHNARN